MRTTTIIILVIEDLLEDVWSQQPRLYQLQKPYMTVVAIKKAVVMSPSARLTFVNRKQLDRER